MGISSQFEDIKYWNLPKTFNKFTLEHKLADDNAIV